MAMWEGIILRHAIVFFFPGISHSYLVSAVSQASTHLRPPPWLHSGQCSQRHGGDGIPGESQPVEVSAKATFEMGKAIFFIFTAAFENQNFGSLSTTDSTKNQRSRHCD